MKNDFDNKLTDKGWQSMLRLLDRELPEQRRRRRFVWWPLALLLLSLAGAGGWWQYRTMKTAPPSPVAIPEVAKPVVTTEDLSAPSAVATQATIPANQPGPASNIDSRTPAHAKHNAVDGLISSKQPAVKSGNLVSDHVSKSHASEKNSSGQVPASPSKEPDAVVASPLVLVYPVETGETSKGNNPAFPSKNTSEIKKFDPLAPLPSRSSDTAPQIVTSVEGCFANGATIKKKNTTRWSFGIGAGLASENFSSLNGFSAGGVVDWQFARKWGLRSGLQYGHYRLSSDERPVVSVAAEDYTEATGNLVLGSGTANPYQDADSTSVLVPVDRLQQLEMPLLAYWQPLRALRIYGGISVAYNLSAQASEQNYSNNQYYYASSQDAKSNLNKLAVSNIQRWQTNLQTGLGFRLGRHFELGAFYKYGLGDFKIGNWSADYDSSFFGNGADQSSGQKGASHYFLFNGIWFF